MQDGMQIYEYEGQESPVGSVGCCSLLDADDNLDFLNDLGPKFKTLAEICTGSAIEIDSSTAASAHDVHFGGVSSSSSTATRTEITTEASLTASQAPPAHTVESVVTETSYATSTAPVPVPRVQVTENVMASSSAYLVQPTPVVYAAAPCLQTTRYVLEPPGVGTTLLVTDRPASAQGMYVVNDALRTGEMVVLREHVGPTVVPAGAASVNEGVVLVEQHHVLREADAGRGHTLLHMGSPGPGHQNLLVVERQVVTESQSEPRQVRLQERSPSASPGLLVVESHKTTESQSWHPQVILQERSPSASPGLLVVGSHMTRESQSGYPQVILQERSASPSPNLLVMESQVAMESGHQQVLRQGPSPSVSQDALQEVSTGSTHGGQSPASQNSTAGGEGASLLSGSQEERVELQVAAPSGAHRVVRQEKQISFTESSVQQITTSSEQVPI